MKRIARLSLFAFVLAAEVSAADDAGISDIELPPGFSIEVYAEVPNARSLALGEDGVVFVSNRRANSVYAVVPQRDVGPDVIELATGLSTPNGIAFHQGDLYVAEIDRVLRFRDISGRLNDKPEPEVLDIDLPGERHHGWRYIGFGPDDKLYVSVGAPCNICDRAEEGFAQIVRMNPDGTERETVAHGVRNSVGFTWHPDTEELWFTDNGRDMLGDDLPADELNHATEPGMHFGYPYCHAGDIPDPEFGDGVDCTGYTPPVQKLGPHVAALGLTFYTGDMFPTEYHGQVFIAEHGSWNRSEKTGYRISRVRLDGDTPSAYEVFAEGWLQAEEVSGRPVDLLVLEDGSMLVSDDHADRIYRISYNK